MGQITVILIFFFVILYVGICLLVYSNQENLIFYPEKLTPDYKFQLPFDFEEKIFIPEEDVSIHSIHAKTSSGPAKGLILYFHGNAGSLKDWAMVCPQFLDLGYEVLIPDYRTYGKSTGKLSEKAMLKDAEFIYSELCKTWKEDQIILYGRSLGTGIAAWLAVNKNPKQLILESPYSSMDAMGAGLLPFLPVKMLLKYHFRNDINLAKAKTPIHIFHGSHDSTIPLKHSLKLKALLNEEKAGLTIIDGGGHNDLEDFPAYHDKLRELLGVLN